MIVNSFRKTGYDYNLSSMIRPNHCYASRTINDESLILSSSWILIESSSLVERQHQFLLAVQMRNIQKWLNHYEHSGHPIKYLQLTTIKSIARKYLIENPE
eukprot:TRINITY_DN1754_c0_g1_i1.p12 TRINITY_DN1754_c0_g1~~TRINITY_DN1754_c0_g1_i1.p12  ORF type:complete len:101 (-),score=0.25 TRINITY_DN1754_c0_g1_i1:1700-2002(-)